MTWVVAVAAPVAALVLLLFVFRTVADRFLLVPDALAVQTIAVLAP